MSLIYCHVAHCLSINGICDSLGLHCALLNSIRNATAPRRNTLAHANKTRSSEAIKAVYYAIPAHCHTVHPAFCARGHRCCFRFPRRLKRAVRAIDSTTIELISKCMDWARHRRRKAAAKLHMSLDAASFLPVRIVSEPANRHDSHFMVELCRGMKAGDIAVFEDIIPEHTRDMYADSAYMSARREAALKAAKKRPHIVKRKTRNSPPLTGRQKHVNRVISKNRCRVEHVFGQIKQFGGDTVRSIGMARCAVMVARVNIVYNMLRFACLKFQEQQALTV